MATTQYKVEQGDQFTMVTTIRDGDNNVVDLTGATVELVVKSRISATDLFTVTVLPAAHTDPENGITGIPLTSENLATRGDYIAKIYTTFPNEDRISSPVFDFIIDEEV